MPLQTDGALNAEDPHKALTYRLKHNRAHDPSSKITIDEQPKSPQQASKQSRVVEMLQSPKGATVAAMVKATGWQPHSVRGFLAGVVRKRLKLKLNSEVIEGDRVYRVAGSAGMRTSPRQIKR